MHRSKRGVCLAGLAILAMLAAEVASAQTILYADVEHALHSPLAKAPEGFEDLEISTDLFTIDANPVLIPMGRISLLNGLNFSYLRFDDIQLPDSTVEGTQPGHEAFSTRYKLIAVVPGGRRWTWMLELLPGFATDAAGGIGAHAWFLHGGVLLRRHLNNGSSWLVGLRYGSVTGSPLPYPVLGYQSYSRRWDVNILLPLQSRLVYRANDGFAFGLVQRLHGEEYGLDREGYEDNMMQISLLSTSLRLEATVSSGFVAYMDLGMQAGLRRYDVLDGAGDPRLDYDLSPAPFLRLGFALRPPREQLDDF